MVTLHIFKLAQIWIHCGTECQILKNKVNLCIWMGHMPSAHLKTGQLWVAHCQVSSPCTSTGMHPLGSWTWTWVLTLTRQVCLPSVHGQPFPPSLHPPGFLEVDQKCRVALWDAGNRVRRYLAIASHLSSHVQSFVQLFVHYTGLCEKCCQPWVPDSKQNTTWQLRK